MTTRTFICTGNGVSLTPPTSLVVTLDGIEIFNGAIPTVADQQWFTPDQLQQVFSWEMDLDQTAWEKPMTITVSGGDFVLGEIKANYIVNYLETNTLAEKHTNFLESGSVYREIYSRPWNSTISTIDDHTTPLTEPVLAEGDPKFDIKIDGISRQKSGIDSDGNPKVGQWFWQVGDESVISFVLKCNIKPIPSEVL